MAKKKNQPVEVRIEIDGLDITAVSNQHNADIDRLLELRGADSFVFVPLAKLGKRRHRLFGKPAAIARKKAKLPELEWYDGELHNLDHHYPVRLRRQLKMKQHEHDQQLLL